MEPSKSNGKELKFHEERRMFCMHLGKLWLAPQGTPDSHKIWFLQEGWLADDPHLIDHIARGYVDFEGNIFFYRGDFEVDKEVEALFFPYLDELVAALSIPEHAQLFGGAIKDEIGLKWLAKKEYGEVIKYTK